MRLTAVSNTFLCSSKRLRKHISIDDIKKLCYNRYKYNFEVLMDKYVPPYEITEEMLELTSEIAEELGKFSNVTDL